MAHDESERFVLGTPVQDDEARPSTYSARAYPSETVAWLLVLMMVAATAIAVYFVLNEQPPASQPPAPIHAASGQFLSAAPAPLAPADAVPAWLVTLVSLFTILQILPLLTAYNWARRPVLTKIQIRKAQFLCEIPMYLGLLGSLLGVCATQFTTGSLAAPLAYLTSITGIILHLFGRFSISLTLPETE